MLQLWRNANSRGRALHLAVCLGRKPHIRHSSGFLRSPRQRLEPFNRRLELLGWRVKLESSSLFFNRAPLQVTIEGLASVASGPESQHTQGKFTANRCIPCVRSVKSPRRRALVRGNLSAGCTLRKYPCEMLPATSSKLASG